MEGPKEDPDDVGEQGDDVGRRADFADRHIHLCYNHIKSRNEGSSCWSLFQKKLLENRSHLHLDYILHFSLQSYFSVLPIAVFLPSGFELTNPQKSLIVFVSPCFLF